MERSKTTDTELPRRTTVPYDAVRQLHTEQSWIEAWHDLCESEEPAEASFAGLLHVAFERGRLSSGRVLNIVLSVAMSTKLDTDDYNSVRERLRAKAISVINTRFLAKDRYKWRELRNTLLCDMATVFKLLSYLQDNRVHGRRLITDLRGAVYHGSNWPFMRGGTEEDHSFWRDFRERLRGHEDFFITCCGTSTISPEDDDFREALRRWVFRPGKPKFLSKTERNPDSIKDALLFKDRIGAVAELVDSDNKALEEARQRRARLPKKSKVPAKRAAIRAADARLVEVQAFAFKPPQEST